MDAADCVVAAEVDAELGDNLRLVTQCLWPVDCQTCGDSLAPEAPALCVDVIGQHALASIHHRSCRESQWNNTGVIGTPSANLTTHELQAVVIPGEPFDLVWVLLNPGLEQVGLIRDNGGWRISLSPWLGGGFTHRGPRFRVGTPLPGGTIALNGHHLTIGLPDNFRPYDGATCGAASPIDRIIKERNGAALAVSNALRPSVVGRLLDVQAAFRLTDGLALAWLPLVK